jgi:hypothetical protein
LGLCGAIYKRLYEETNNNINLKNAIWFYEKGFYIKQDYYNAINAAYLYTLQSTVQKNKEQAITDYNLGNRIRNKVIVMCKNIIGSKDFKYRRDKNWVYYTLAEAYTGLVSQRNANAMEKIAIGYSEGKFDIDSFNTQKKKLVNLIIVYKKKWG